MKRIKSEYLWALIIFAIALSLRIIYFLQVKAGFPGWDSPTIDPLYHDLWARQIASGDILGVGPFFRAPFYAYFLGLIYAVFGPSLAVSKIIQHIIGSATCSLIFLFSERYFGRRIAIVSGLVSAFYWVFIYFEDELLLDSLLVLFSLVLIWALMRAAEKTTMKWFFVAGMILGLAAITRPNYLVIWPVIAVWMFVVFGRKYKWVLARFTLLTLGCLIFILPVTLRNIIVGDDLVLIASQGGINFYIGNNERATGATAVMPEFGATWQYADCEYLARLETARLGQKMKPSEVSAFYYRRALRFIDEYPVKWLGLIFKKLSYFWNSYEISNNQNLYFFRRFASISGILPPLFFIISPLSIIGLVSIFRRERIYHIIGYFIIAYMLTVVAFFVTSRFRLPVLPLVIILASSALLRIVEKIKLKDFKTLIAICIALLILLPLTNIDLFGISHSSFAMSHFSLGNVYLKKRMPDEALDEYEKAIRLAPCVPSAHLNRGIIYFGRLDFENARREFLQEIDKCRRSARAHNNLSVLDRLQGDSESALRQARMAIAESPQYLEAYVNEILALRVLRDDASAYRVADSLTVIFPNYLPGHYFKGKMMSERGIPDSAESEFRLIIESAARNIIEKYDLSTIYSSQTPYGYKPERVLGLAYYELGLLTVQRGRMDSALTLFKKTTEFLPAYPDGWINLALAYDQNRLYRQALAAYQKSIELDPDNALAYYNLGLTLGKVGLFEEAVEAFRIAIEIKPDFPEAQQKLRLTQSLLKSSPEQ
jgi:tetratricopeptide (TPR) repeat protein